tara:strand:- start:1378 stop:2661 length:1284 start_codon:yes stop_codon:yes gene_type:complete
LRDKIKILKNKKSLMDIVKLSSIQIVLRPLQIIKSFVVAKYLGPESYGILKSVELIAMLNKFGSLGFKPTIIRNGITAMAKGDINELKSIKDNAYSGELVLSFILLLFGIISSFFFDNKIIVSAILLASVGLFTAKMFGIFQTELQLNKNFGSLAKVILYQGILNSVFVMVLVPFFNIHAVLMVPIISSPIIIYLAYKKTGNFFSLKIDRIGIKKILKVSIPFTFGTLAYGLFRYTERTIVIIFMGLKATGFFGFADTIANIFITLMLGSVMKVRSIKLFEYLGKKKYLQTHRMVIKETSILVGISFVIILGLAIGMKLLIPQILPKWEGAILATIIYSFVIPIKLSSSYIASVIKSPTVNELNFEPIMQIISTFIIIIGATILHYNDSLSLNNYILIILIALLFLHSGYIVFYYFKYYLPYIKIKS